MFDRPLTSVEDVDHRSEFARVHGRPPRNDVYREYRANGFEDWTLTIDGLLDEPMELSLEEVRALPKCSQTTRHDCVQGWSYYAQWAGVPVSELLVRREPRAEAERVVFHSLDEKWHHPEMNEYYYESIDLETAREPGSILAYEMNDGPLPVPHGAPLRLRIEGKLGYKMVKWVTHIEVVADVDHLGAGEGGWSEGVFHYAGEADL